MNTKIELACHDCIQLIANGETEGAGMDWDMDAALNTQELHEVSLADGEEYFPLRIAQSATPASQATATLWN